MDPAIARMLTSASPTYIDYLKKAGLIPADYVVQAQPAVPAYQPTGIPAPALSPMQAEPELSPAELELARYLGF